MENINVKMILSDEQCRAKKDEDPKPSGSAEPKRLSEYWKKKIGNQRM